MNTFYFNTGVKPETVFNPSFPYEYHRKKGNIIRNTLLIPFDCDAPKNAKFIMSCDNPNLSEIKSKNVIVREMFNTNMLSKYAYFEI